MKYLKNAFKLINAYPAILLVYMPALIISMLFFIFGFHISSSYTDMIMIMAYTLLISVVSILAQLIITKMVFTLRRNDKKDYDINIKDALRNIPKMLLNLVVIVAVSYGLVFALSISIVPNALGIAYYFTSTLSYGAFAGVLFSIGGVVKILIYILCVIYLSIYSVVFMMFLNMNLTISDMMKAAMKYTFINFKKLFSINMLGLFLPQIIILSSTFIFNIVNGLSFSNMYFMSTKIYLALQLLNSCIALLYIVAVILTWNDEEDKSQYLLPSNKTKKQDVNITRDNTAQEQQENQEA